MFHQVNTQFSQSSYSYYQSTSKNSEADNESSQTNSTSDNVGTSETSKTQDTELSPQVQVFDVEEVVGNITQFVRGRINTLPEDQQAEALEQAKEGLQAGFDEARDILTSMNKLSEDMSNGIDNSLDQLMDKFKDLDSLFSDDETGDLSDAVADETLANLVDQPTAVETSTPTKSEPKNTPIDYAFSPKPDNFLSSSSRQYSEAAAYYERKQSMVLNVKTNDGDTVQLKFNQSDSAGAARLSGNGVSASYFEGSSDQQMSFTVEGNLDQGELDALNELFSDVSKLADEFYDGDLEKAFDMALELDIDFSELSSMSLNMSDATSYAAQSYSEVSGKTSMPKAFEPLKSYVQSFADLVNQANQTLDLPVGINDLMDMLPQTNYKHSQLHGQLLSSVNSLLNVA